MISHRSTASKKSRVSSVRGSLNEVPRVQIFLDLHLNKAFDQIKSQKKKKIINTGTKNAQIKNNKSQIPSQRLKNIQNQITMLPNDMVMKYIKQVYTKYKIKNPLEEQEAQFVQVNNLNLYNPKKINESTVDCKPNKFQTQRNSIATTKYPNSQSRNYQTQKKDKRMSITRNKILDLKNKYKNEIILHEKHEQNTIKRTNYEIQLQEQPHYTQNQTLDFENTSAYTINNGSKVLSPHNKFISCFDEGQTIALKNKRKLFVKTKPRAISTNPSCSLAHSYQRKIENNISAQNLQQSHFNQTYNVSQAIQSSRKQQKQEVKAVYRYCLMCEQCILQHNITFHQKKCKLLEKAYSLNLNELLSIVEQKINRIKKEIIDSPLYNLNEDKINKTKKTVNKWLLNIQSDQCKNIFNEYQKVKQQIKFNYLESCQLINKLNWFIKLKKNFLQRQA